MGSIARTIANSIKTDGTLDSDASNSVNFRNLIINGDMSIAQRGTSQAGVSSNTFNTDRFELRNNIGAYTIAQETLTSGDAYNNGFRSAFRVDTTTADASPVSTSALFVRTKLEGQMLQYIKKGTANAEQLTLSFWVKSNQTGTGIVALRDIDNDRMVGGTYTISSADTWEKKIITFPADTTGAFDNDNGESINLEWWLDSGSNFNTGTLQTSWAARANADSNVGSSLSIADSTSNDWAITGVQLEVGTSASDFEFLPYDVNLQRCRRYYTQINQNGSNPFATFSARVNGASDVENIGIPLTTSLRTGNPTVTKSGSCIAQAWDDTGYHATSAGGGTFSVFSDTGNNTPYLNCKCNGFSGLTGGAANISFVLGTPSIEVDAEL